MNPPNAAQAEVEEKSGARPTPSDATATAAVDEVEGTVFRTTSDASESIVTEPDETAVDEQLEEEEWDNSIETSESGFKRNVLFDKIRNAREEELRKLREAEVRRRKITEAREEELRRLQEVEARRCGPAEIKAADNKVQGQSSALKSNASSDSTKPEDDSGTNENPPDKISSADNSGNKKKFGLKLPKPGLTMRALPKTPFSKLKKASEKNELEGVDTKNTQESDYPKKVVTAETTKAKSNLSVTDQNKDPEVDVMAGDEQLEEEGKNSIGTAGWSTPLKVLDRVAKGAAELRKKPNVGLVTGGSTVSAQSNDTAQTSDASIHTEEASGCGDAVAKESSLSIPSTTEKFTSSPEEPVVNENVPSIFTKTSGCNDAGDKESSSFICSTPEKSTSSPEEPLLSENMSSISIHSTMDASMDQSLELMNKVKSDMKQLHSFDAQLRKDSSWMKKKASDFVCGIFSCFGKSEEGGTTDGTASVSEDSIGSNDVKFVLNNFPEDQEQMLVWTPSLQHEIDDVNKKLIRLEAKESANKEQMNHIKQHLMGEQRIPDDAPDDVKEAYFRALSRGAVLNARLESRRAELELQKIGLESVRIDMELDRAISDEFSDETSAAPNSFEEKMDAVASKVEGRVISVLSGLASKGCKPVKCSI